MLASLFEAILWIAIRCVQNKNPKLLLYVGLIVILVIVTLFCDLITSVENAFDGDFSLSARTASIEFFCEKAKGISSFGMRFITSSKNQDEDI